MTPGLKAVERDGSAGKDGTQNKGLSWTLNEYLHF